MIYDADYINDYNRGKDKKTSKVDFIDYCQDCYFVSNASLVDKNQKNFSCDYYENYLFFFQNIYK